LEAFSTKVIMSEVEEKVEVPVDGEEKEEEEATDLSNR
jgi:hypothetical protein